MCLGLYFEVGIGREDLIVGFIGREDFWVLFGEEVWSWWFRLERKLKLGMDKRLRWLGLYVLVRESMGFGEIEGRIIDEVVFVVVLGRLLLLVLMILGEVLVVKL